MQYFGIDAMNKIELLRIQNLKTFIIITTLMQSLLMQVCFGSLGL